MATQSSAWQVTEPAQPTICFKASCIFPFMEPFNLPLAGLKIKFERVAENVWPGEALIEINPSLAPQTTEGSCTQQLLVLFLIRNYPTRCHQGEPHRKQLACSGTQELMIPGASQSFRFSDFFFFFLFRLEREERFELFFVLPNSGTEKGKST